MRHDESGAVPERGRLLRGGPERLSLHAALPLILAALGVAKGVAGGIQANQTRQRSKGLINEAYATGQTRMAGAQRDERQGLAESLGARGLSQGGMVTADPVRPNVATGRRTAVPNDGTGPLWLGGATNLGQQDTLTQRGEQALESTQMRQQRDQALAGVNANATATMVGSAAGGVAGAFQGYQAGKNYEATRAKSLASTSAFGVDPVNPLGGPGSAWNQRSVDQFNIYNNRG